MNCGKKFTSNDKNFILYNEDCFEILQNLQNQIDLIFADPPYFLSNDGIISVRSGEGIVSLFHLTLHDYERFFF